MKDLRYFLNKIATIRKALQELEEELAKEVDPDPATPKKKNAFRQQLEDNELTGTWRKPAYLKKKK